MRELLATARRRVGQLAVAVAAAAGLPLALLSVLHPQPEGVVLMLDEGRFGADATLDPWQPAPGARHITLPHDWRSAGQRHEGAVGTYHFQLDLQVPPDRLWAIYLPSLSMNAAVYLNGEILGDGGAMTPPVARHWSRPLYVIVPNGLLRAGRNVLAIRIVAEPAGSGLLAAPRLAAHETLRGTFEQRHALTAVATFAIVMLLATVAALMAVLWASRRRETVYLWFALACTAWGVHLLNLVVVEPPLPTRAWAWLWCASGAWLVICALLFVLRFLGDHAPRTERLHGLAAILAPTVLAIVAAAWPGRFATIAGLPWATGLLASGILPLALLLRRLGRQPTPEVAWLAFAGLAMFCLATHDWLLMAGQLPRTNGLLLHYSAPVVLLTFGYILVRRFVDALNRAESMNAELERRVAAREAELARHHERLRLLERDQAIAGERERLMRDMHDGVGGTILAALHLSQQAGPDRQRITETLRHALQDLRLMIDSLDPLDGDLTLLLAMFRSRAEPQLKAAGLQSSWSLADLPPWAGLTPERALQLLRIAQEAVHNTIRHAGATCLEVRLVLDRDGQGRPLARLELRDDGRGFDPQHVARGRGLDNMRRRALEAGLQLGLSSGPRGTSWQIGIPLV